MKNRWRGPVQYMWWESGTVVRGRDVRVVIFRAEGIVVVAGGDVGSGE